MKKLIIITSIGLLVTASLFACKSAPSDTSSLPLPTAEATPTLACPALPKTFKGTDLVGTWIARYRLHDSDILTINEDGTYQQIYSDPDANQRLESGWQKWWVEYRNTGYARLHLHGMRRCDDVSSICEREGGGLPELLKAIDYCENNVVRMPDEVVLIVTGANYDTPRGVLLRQTRLSGSDWTWSFSLSIK